jgi:hypothetical protein
MAMAKFRGVRTMRLTAAAVGAALLAAGLCACTMSDDTLSRFLVAPDKYVLYTCPQIADELAKKQKEEQKLTALMAQASQGAGGGVIGRIAYRPDYLSAHGEEIDLRQAAAAKNCTGMPAEAPPARASNDAIR